MGCDDDPGDGGANDGLQSVAPYFSAPVQPDDGCGDSLARRAVDSVLRVVGFCAFLLASFLDILFIAILIFGLGGLVTIAFWAAHEFTHSLR